MRACVRAWGWVQWKDPRTPKNGQYIYKMMCAMTTTVLPTLQEAIAFWQAQTDSAASAESMASMFWSYNPDRDIAEYKPFIQHSFLTAVQDVLQRNSYDMNSYDEKLKDTSLFPGILRYSVLDIYDHDSVALRGLAVRTGGMEVLLMIASARPLDLGPVLRAYESGLVVHASPKKLHDQSLPPPWFADMTVFKSETNVQEHLPLLLSSMSIFGFKRAVPAMVTPTMADLFAIALGPACHNNSEKMQYVVQDVLPASGQEPDVNRAVLQAGELADTRVLEWVIGQLGHLLTATTLTSLYRLHHSSDRIAPLLVALPQFVCTDDLLSLFTSVSLGHGDVFFSY